ncbi:MFS transporter [Nocardioides speluncae]|uniref:MFS transporter n=1 Tax=Nocardioides speluncae TaxID=2670337 RepID=UPI000D695DA2|nr:MFS transporter [Nocardioides speluncae]
MKFDKVTTRLLPLFAAFFLGGVALWVPIEKLFLVEIGFTPQTVGVMAAAYAALVPLLEVPSGILADRWSRRGVLMIGNLGAFASVLLGGLSTNVGTYIAAAMLLGVYFAMQSGTFDAIVYDTVLEETGSSDRFESVIGRVRLAESAALVLGALAGGALAAATEPRVTYFATLPFLVASTLCLLAFREPVLHQQGESRSLREHVSVTARTLRRNPRLLPVAALLILAGLVTTTLFEFGPLWLVDGDAGAAAYGPMWAALMAALGLGGILAGRFRFDTSAAQAATAVVLLGAGAVLVLVESLLLVTVAQVLLVALTVTLAIFFTRLLHDGVASDVRSGVASGVGAATWLVFLPFALLFGWVSERWGVHAAGSLLLLAGAAAVPLLLVVTRRGTPTAPEVVVREPIAA